MKKTFMSVITIIIFGGIFFLGFPILQQKDKKITDDTTSIKEVVSTTTSHTNKKIEVLRKEHDNPEIEAIISSESIGLDAIVVQSDDNDYYMDHDIYKNYAKKGSIFLDYRNTFSSKKLLIYGHNSATEDTDFGRLEKYLNEEFVKNNPYVELVTSFGKTKWEIFSVMVVPNNTTTHTRIEFSNVNMLEEHIRWMINNSKVKLDVEVNIRDQLMTLQTCYYEPEDSFLLINLKKVEDNNV